MFPYRNYTLTVKNTVKNAVSEDRDAARSDVKSALGICQRGCHVQRIKNVNSGNSNVRHQRHCVFWCFLNTKI